MSTIKIAFVSFVFLNALAHAKADYALSCSQSGSTSNVYACNRGDSAEGNNEYVSVTACSGSRCDEDYDLMYIYAASGDCELVGSIEFDEAFDFCTATLRP